MRSTNGGNISAKVSWDRKKAEVAAGLRLRPLGSKARFNSHRKPMPRVLSVRRRAAWGGRGKGCPKRGKTGPTSKAGDLAPCHTRACPHPPARKHQPVIARPKTQFPSFICLACSAGAAWDVPCLQRWGTTLPIPARNGCVFPPARGRGGNGSRRWRRRWRAGSTSPHRTSLRRGDALGVREKFGVSVHVASLNRLLCLHGCDWNTLTQAT